MRSASCLAACITHGPCCLVLTVLLHHHTHTCTEIPAPADLRPLMSQVQGNNKLKVGLQAKNRLLQREAIEFYNKGIAVKCSDTAVNVALINNKAHVNSLLGEGSVGFVGRSGPDCDSSSSSSGVQQQ